MGVAFAFNEEGGAAAASWPPAGRFRGTPACLWVVPRCVPAWVAAGSMAATRNLMAAAGLMALSAEGAETLEDQRGKKNARGAQRRASEGAGGC